MIEKLYAEVTRVIEDMRLHTTDERMHEYMDELGHALQKLEQEAIENEERLKETQVRKVA